MAPVKFMDSQGQRRIAYLAILLSLTMALLVACQSNPSQGKCVYRTGLTPKMQDFLIPARPGAPALPGEIRATPSEISVAQYEPSKQLAEYFINLNVGGRNIGLVADTGSSSLVVLGNPSICSDCASISGVYTPGPDSVRYPNEFQVEYGSGQATNILFADTIYFPCDAADPIPMYQFGVVEKNNNLPNIFGLAYPSLLRPQGLARPILPFFDQFLTTYPKSQDIIGITLCGDRDGSSIVFGGPDDRLSPSDRDRMVWVSIEKDPRTHTFSHYIIDALNLTVDGWKKGSSGNWIEDPGAKDVVLGDFGAAGSPGRPSTILDTGSTLNHLPVNMNKEIIALMKSVNKAKNANIDATFFDSGGPVEQSRDIERKVVDLFPTLHLNVKVISPKEANAGIGQLDWPPNIYFKKNPPEAQSKRRMFSFRNSQGIYILGQAFLENWYVEHDRGIGQIGFYPNAALCK
jgi:hypothetical protein